MSDESRSDEARWDRGLKAVFGGEQAESVLESIERVMGATSRILLHDPPADESPLLRVPSLAPGADHAEDDSRYHIVGEIARGGVGIVHKARDKDLGRDVALKLLRQEQAEKPEVFARFIEEAQIGAQLQHPGIVPVYGLGLQPDRRPFFTMKLIKGRTLSALLKERAGPSKGRRRFLAIFEQACQTMAYAHARGVIHRDLKPSNIMVGSFGEVQIVDWGFGKVLGREDHAAERLAERTIVTTVRSEQDGSHSIAGSVMGTPAYMPPEQALGHVDRLDERSDVFALGAILCEILTGKPPYTGRQSDLVVKAAQARLDEAHERLAACDAAEELTALAKHCLMPVGEERPEHAGELAQAIAAHLAAAEERARKAELRAIHQRARLERQRRRAQWERGRKRRTRLVAAALLAAVACGGGAYLWADAQQVARAEAARPGVEDAMGEAARLRSRGQFGAALTMARKALDLAAAGEVDSALRQRASRLVRRAQQDLEAADEARRREEAGAAFVRELEEIRLARSEHRDFRASDRQYLAAFRALDLEPEDIRIADLLRETYPGVLLDVAAALDGWASLRRTEEVLAGTDWESLVAVARAIDPDPWRNRLRDAAAKEGLGTLRALAREALEQDLPAHTLDLLGRALGGAGDPEAAVRVYRAAARAYPEDPWVNANASYFLLELSPPQHADAVRFATAALALRPASASAHNMLGIALRSAGDLEAALAALQRTVRLAPTYFGHHINLGAVLHDLGRYDEAVAVFRRAIRLHPGSALAHSNLGRALSGERRFADSEAAFRKAIGLDMDLATAHAGLAGVLALTGRPDEAEASARKAIQLEPGHAWIHYGLGRVLRAQGRWAEAVDAQRKAVRLAPWDSRVRHELGVCLEGMGRKDEAAAAYRAAIGLKPAIPGPLVHLGRLLRDDGKLDEAIGLLEEATRLKPGSHTAHDALEKALQRAGRLELFEAETREAILRGEPNQAVLHARLASTLRRLGRPREAVTASLEAIRLDQTLFLAWRNLGVAYHQVGQLDDAIEAYQEAVRLQPAAHVYGFLGNLLMDHRNDIDGALAAFRKAVRLGTYSAKIHFTLGVLLTRVCDLEGAEAALQGAIRLRPSFWEARRSLGHVLFEQGDLERAIAAYREAIPLSPRRDQPYRNLGDALLLLHRLDEAAEAYREALHRDADDGLAVLSLGLVFLAKGDLENAVAEFRKAARLSDDRWVHEVLDRGERALALGPRWRRASRGEVEPADAAEALLFAWLAQSQLEYEVAVRLYERAFASGHPPARFGFAAASAAVQAARSATGVDAARRRRQALAWLRAQLESLERVPEETRRERLRAWRCSSDLAGVRDEQALAKLPEAEGKEWRALWAEVAGLVSEAK